MEGSEDKKMGGNSKISGEQERAFLQVVKFQKLREAFEANANGGLLLLRRRNYDYATCDCLVKSTVPYYIMAP